MTDPFPSDSSAVTQLLVVSDVDRGGEVRAFFRDPDGHLIEISEVG